ncbi:hypothetical protein [Roseitalea porphyridii]|uniref:PepSY domain-containing protein n=1 Tax=Roseitalea porphyridii TaxID=1852022 RepID=A0A4P6V2L9_9HYPH|nr:hypothetical protein [Roseitalea porphyridii]QBK31435.1 hypothetical protein E0E05_12970 [Roseitalea porphyridii]
MKPILTTTASALALALTFGPATAQQTSDELNRGVIDACRAILDAQANASADRNMMNGNGNGENGLRADAGIQPGEQIPQTVPDYPNDAQAAEAMAQTGNEIDPLDNLQNPGEQIASTTQPNDAATTSTNRQIDMQAGQGTVAKRYRSAGEGFDNPGRIETEAGAASVDAAQGTIADRYVPIYGGDEDQRSADAGPVERPDRDMVDHQNGSFDAARDGRAQEGPIAETYDDFAATIDQPGGRQADDTNPLREGSEMISEGLTAVEPGLNQQADRGDLDPVTNGEDAMNGGATAMGEPDSGPIPAERDQTDLVERDRTATSERDRQMARNGSDRAQPAPTDRRSVQRAYQVASAVVPHVRFSGWQRTNEGGSAYVFAGVNRVTGRPTAIYMTDGARVNEIRERIPLRAVPTDLRRTIGSEIEGLRVSSVARSLRSDFDVYYEFDGILRSGRPVAIEIRADGEDFTMNAPTNS